MGVSLGFVADFASSKPGWWTSGELAGKIALWWWAWAVAATRWVARMQSIYAKQKPRRTNVLLLPGLAFGGAMGLLAGYGALRLALDYKIISPETKVIEVEAAPVSPARPPSSPKRVTSSASDALATMHPDDRDVQRPTVTRPRRQVVDMPRGESQDVAEPIPQMAAARSEAELSRVEPREEASPVENPAEALPPPSVLITLALDDANLNAIATPEGIAPNELLCDVAFSPELMEDWSGSEADREKLQVVGKGLKPRDSRMYELPLRVKDGSAAIEISIATHATTAVCQIRPQFSLRSSGVQPLTIKRGSDLKAKFAKLAKMAEDSNAELPGLRQHLEGLKRDLSTAEANRSRRGPHTAMEGARQNQASVAAGKLRSAVSATENRIAKQEALQRDAQAVNQDAACLAEVERYARRILNKAQIYVRFYHGTVTVPAVVK